ncbi:MAG: hypothetical protein M3P82_07220, partial [Bacteroidota bacterium]|nr:hypothetical protein [Bacteroidota bacterium]
MEKIKLLLRSVALVSVVILPLIFLDSCSFCISAGSFFCKLIGDAPLAELTGSSSTIAISSLDTLIVYHGSQCAKSTKTGTKDVIKIEGVQELPAFVTNATVYINGWNLEYLDPDHHVAGLGVVIKNIRLEEVPEKKVFALKWDATGILSDQNLDDSYSMCYTYTVIAWSDKNVNLNIDHDDGSCTDTDLLQANFYESNNEGSTT